MKQNLCQHRVTFNLKADTSSHYQCLFAGQFKVTPVYRDNLFTCAFSQACNTIKVMSNFAVSLNFIVGEGSSPFEVEIGNTQIKVIDEIKLISNQERPLIFTKTSTFRADELLGYTGMTRLKICGTQCVYERVIVNQDQSFQAQSISDSFSHGSPLTLSLVLESPSIRIETSSLSMIWIAHNSLV